MGSHVSLVKYVKPLGRGGSNLRQGPIQRRFGPSCIRRVYFIPMSTECHDIRTECQIINTSHSFFTVLLISHKLPAIDQLLAPQSLPNRSPIAPPSTEAVLSNLFLDSEAENLNPPSKIAFPGTVPYSVNEHSIILFT